MLYYVIGKSLPLTLKRNKFFLLNLYRFLYIIPIIYVIYISKNIFQEKEELRHTDMDRVCY